MSDNPFPEPSDYERTVIVRPVPGGRPAAQPVARAPEAPPETRPAPAGTPAGPITTGQSALVVAATPLLQLLGRLRNVFNPPDAGKLRARTIQAVRDFETAARAAGVPHEVLHPARYALCASVDDVVLHTPWGAASPWVQASLVSTFHQEVISGEGFFIQLAALKRDPARNLMLLELMYLCLSLGYMGQYRLSSQGPAQVEQLREDLYQTIVRLRGAYEHGLSPRWRGIDAPYRPARAVVPVWVMAAAALAVVGLSWLFLSNRLNEASVATLAEAASAPPLQMPTLERPPPPHEQAQQLVLPVAQPRQQNASAFTNALHQFLQPEIDAKLVAVEENAQIVRVRIFNGGMFEPAKAVVRPDFVSLLERIGDALNTETGSALVTGHTDSDPLLRRFPYASNLELSVARATAASAIMAHKLRDLNRLTIEGRADTEPAQPNDTDAHKAQNRRIEIILQKRS